MNDWHSTTLGKVLPFQYGKNLPKGARSHTGEFAVVSSAGFIDTHSEPLTKDPTVVIGRKGTVGSVFYCPDPVFPIDTTFYVEGSSKVSIRFAYYLLKSLPLTEMNTDAAVPGLNRANAERLEIQLPGPEYQQAIVEVLGSIDDLIENNWRRIKVLEEMTRAIYREWFVKFRYPGHEGVPLVDSTLGPIPEGWRAATIGDALELKYGKALKASARRGGGVAVVSSAGVVGWHDESFVDGPAIVVGRKGNVGSVHWVDGPCWPIDTAYFVQTDLPLRFVSEQLRRTAFTNSHAAVPGLSREAAYAQPFLLPDVQVLDSFQALVDPLGSHATGFMSQNEKLAEVRDLLLPKLVTGQIDVSSLDLDAVISTGSTEESAVAQ